MRIGIGTAIAVSLTSSALFLISHRVRALAQPLTGKEGLVGAEAGAQIAGAGAGGRAALVGMVLVHGELWRARANKPFPAAAT